MKEDKLMKVQRVLPNQEAKFSYGGFILSTSQYLLLPQQPLKMRLAIKVVKIDSKINMLLP